MKEGFEVNTQQKACLIIVDSERYSNMFRLCDDINYHDFWYLNDVYETFVVKNSTKSC